jgi:hypothetical protein
MKNKRCSDYQRINGQGTFQLTTKVVPSSEFSCYKTFYTEIVTIAIIWSGRINLDIHEEPHFILLKLCIFHSLEN